MKNISKFLATIIIALFSTTLSVGQTHDSLTNPKLNANESHHKEQFYNSSDSCSLSQLRKEINPQLPVFLYYQKVDKFKNKVQKDVLSRSNQGH